MYINDIILRLRIEIISMVNVSIMLKYVSVEELHGQKFGKYEWSEIKRAVSNYLQFQQILYFSN